MYLANQVLYKPRPLGGVIDFLDRLPGELKLLTVQSEIRILSSIGMVKMEIDIDQMSQIIKLFEDSALTEITVEQDNYRLTLRKEARGDRAGSGGEPVTSVSGKDRSSEALATEEEFEEDDDR